MAKPLIIKRQWWRIWRHRLLPWGWEELAHYISPKYEVYMVDGFHRPGDEYQGARFRYRPDSANTGPAPDEITTRPGDGGIWIAPEDSCS